MKADRRRHWFLLQCFLLGSLVGSSSPSSISTRLQSVVSTVGERAILPCSWKSRLGEEAPPTCHIQWKTPVDTVFELRGREMWQAEEFKGRVEVPEEQLGSGDCSLIISDVQIGDAGSYESFMVVDGAKSTKTRVFIQSVRLNVFDHKSQESRRPGENLTLDLRTRHSLRVVFQGSNSSEWSVLWMRDDEDSQRLEKHPLKEQLTMKNVRSSDEGTYKVLDEHGLAVSTVQLAVEERSTTAKHHHVLESQAPAGDAVKSSCSSLLVFSLLVAGLHFLL